MWFARGRVPHVTTPHWRSAVALQFLLAVLPTSQLLHAWHLLLDTKVPAGHVRHSASVARVHTLSAIWRADGLHRVHFRHFCAVLFAHVPGQDARFGGAGFRPLSPCRG